MPNLRISHSFCDSKVYFFFIFLSWGGSDDGAFDLELNEPQLLSTTTKNTKLIKISFISYNYLHKFVCLDVGKKWRNLVIFHFFKIKSSKITYRHVVAWNHLFSIATGHSIQCPFDVGQLFGYIIIMSGIFQRPPI